MKLVGVGSMTNQERIEQRGIIAGIAFGILLVISLIAIASIFVGV